MSDLVAFGKITQALALDSVRYVMSFTRLSDALRCLQQQDPHRQTLELITFGDQQFWIVPAGTAERLSGLGFERLVSLATA